MNGFVSRDLRSGETLTDICYRDNKSNRNKSVYCAVAMYILFDLGKPNVALTRQAVLYLMCLSLRTTEYRSCGLAYCVLRKSY